MRPRVLGSLEPAVRVKLVQAFRLAATRVTELPRCADLFTELGGDGLVSLDTTLYRFLGDAAGDRVCRRGWGAAAFTEIGSACTVLCPAFSGLEVEEAALVVLHEALHHAGRAEWPPVPGALDSAAINRAVKAACEF